ncbi:PIG-L family deacetylase [Nocardioides sp. MAHUQ-72]|uniref:PIG-L family deacetylase n=1 Tax=unclassified Nocardioides TaxID=2615069 RepID=UPI00361D52D1
MTAAFTHDGTGTDAAAWRRHPSWGAVPELTLVNGEVPCSRLVVVAAHPDDESLGAGGLIATAAAAGLTVYVVLLTAGEASHPDSPTLSRHALATRRLAEAERALGILAPEAPLVFLGASDGGVADVEAEVTASLVDLIGDGRATLLAAPWRRDGHPDHEAAGRAAAAAAERTGAKLAEYPIWMWHKDQPDAAPWPQMRRLDLSAQVTQRKWLAIHAHTTQVRPLSPAPSDGVLLPDRVLAHFNAPVEHFVTEPLADPALDDLHQQQADPWGVDERWYEERKRQLTLAALPRPRFRRGLEIGCSTGALAQQLATRCDELVAVDRSPTAVARAGARLADWSTVEVRECDVPRDWPEGRFDLVVVSETGYFLSPGSLDRLIARIGGCLEPGGVVLLCHWRHPVEGWVLDGPDVHERFRASSLPPEMARYEDRDVEISVLAPAEQWPEPSA